VGVPKKDAVEVTDTEPTSPLPAGFDVETMVDVVSAPARVVDSESDQADSEFPKVKVLHMAHMSLSISIFQTQKAESDIMLT
jgi:hypothetical protein